QDQAKEVETLKKAAEETLALARQERDRCSTMVETAVEDRADALRRLAAAEEQAAANRKNTEALEHQATELERLRGELAEAVALRGEFQREAQRLSMKEREGKLNRDKI
ncbi:unnamed protein product, partial [Ascophyllum nodosum]